MWTSALRRELPPGGPHVHEVRTLAECEAMLAEWPASFVVVELAAAPVRALRRVLAWGCDFPRARFAVVAVEGLRWLEADARACGAVAFSISPSRVDGVAQAGLRHIARVPRPPQELTERIWNELPWGG